MSSEVINVLQGDDHWMKHLVGSACLSHYHVHSTFEHAVNLKSEQGDLYTWVSRDMALAPNTLQLECASLTSLNLHVGMKVACCNTYFTLDLSARHSIDFGHASRWCVDLPHYQAFNHTAVIETINHLLSHQPHARTMPQGFEKEAYNCLETLHTGFKNGWLCHDENIMKQSLKQSIGLGIGLTPSGDDAFVGLCAVLAMQNSPVSHLLALCKEIIADAKTATNEISYAALFHAVHGRFNAALVNCLHQFFEDDQKMLEKKLNAVLAIGSTSGADMLRGIRLGLSLFDQRSEPHDH